MLIDKVNFQNSNLAGTKLTTENPEHGNFISAVIKLYTITFQPTKNSKLGINFKDGLLKTHRGKY